MRGLQPHRKSSDVYGHFDFFPPTICNGKSQVGLSKSESTNPKPERQRPDHNSLDWHLFLGVQHHPKQRMHYTTRNDSSPFLIFFLTSLNVEKNNLNFGYITLDSILQDRD